MKINIDSIIVNERMRDLNEDKANEIALSIKEIGLINPITLNQKNELVAGMHRLRAFQLLGYTEIEANVITLEGLKQELAEIDENLIRNDLHYIDKGEHFKRRKEIYEMLYPETKREATLKQYRSAESAERIEPSFVDDTANKTGISSRVIHEELQIANKLEPEVKKQVKEMDLPKSDALELARMQPEKQKQIIEKAKEGKGKVKEAIQIVKKEEKEEARKEEIAQLKEEIEKNPEPPNGLYDVIVIDPPWQYGTEYNPEGRRVASPYPEMSLEDISKIEIPASNDCVLWLWTTHKFMRHSFALLDKWGFQDKVILTWVKDKIGIGSWLRSQTEFCIMAIKGKPRTTLTNQSTVLNAPLREHSRKPDEFYKMIDSLCIGRKLDYFSREKRDGWAQYGNDISKF